MSSTPSVPRRSCKIRLAVPKSTPPWSGSLSFCTGPKSRSAQRDVRCMGIVGSTGSQFVAASFIGQRQRWEAGRCWSLLGLATPAPLQAQELLELDQPRMAALVGVAFDAHLGPSEGHQLVKEDVLRPARAVACHYRHWSLVVWPAESGRLAKTGERSAPKQRLFPFTRRFQVAVSEASGRLGLQKLKISPHSLRHGGPSTDIYRRHLTLEECQRRCRWRCAASVARYENKNKTCPPPFATQPHVGRSAKNPPLTRF